MAGGALGRGQAVVDRQAVLANEMGDDCVAVADRLAIIDNTGQLPTRRLGRVDNVLMPEWDTGQARKANGLRP